MRNFCFLLFKIYILALAIIMPNQLGQASISNQSDIARLESGQVVTRSLTSTLKGNMRGGEAKVLIKSSPEKIWCLIEDQEKLARIIPRIRQVKVLEKTNNSQKVYNTLKVCPFLPAFQYILHIDQREKYKRIKFNRVSGSFNKLYGVWELEPYKGYTLLTYRVVFDLGFYVPPFIRSNSLNKDLPEIMNTIKTKSENM